jgi:hypothetical protein
VTEEGTKVTFTITRRTGARIAAVLATTAVAVVSAFIGGQATRPRDSEAAARTESSDDLTCSDDPDVYWLPACNY